MEIGEFLEAVRTRRSVRRFKPDPIPDEYIRHILEAARWAMSGANGQPWEFIVVRDKGLREKIVQFHKDSRKYATSIEETRIAELRHPAVAVYDEEPGFKDAPVLIVVCADPRTLQATFLSSHFYNGEGGPMATFYKNMANTTQLINLTAAVLGLGSQWVSVNDTWEGEVKELLGIPLQLRVHTIVPIGYPAYKAPPPYRRKLEDIRHDERYDQSKFRDDSQVNNFLLELRRRTTSAYHV